MSDNGSNKKARTVSPNDGNGTDRAPDPEELAAPPADVEATEDDSNTAAANNNTNTNNMAVTNNSMDMVDPSLILKFLFSLSLPVLQWIFVSLRDFLQQQQEPGQVVAAPPAAAAGMPNQRALGVVSPVPTHRRDPPLPPPPQQQQQQQQVAGGGANNNNNQEAQALDILRMLRSSCILCGDATCDGKGCVFRARNLCLKCGDTGHRSSRCAYASKPANIYYCYGCYDPIVDHEWARCPMKSRLKCLLLHSYRFHRQHAAPSLHDFMQQTMKDLPSFYAAVIMAFAEIQDQNQHRGAH